MINICWDLFKGLCGFLMSLRLNRCVYCEYCEDCKAHYRVPGPGGRPVPICKHCITDEHMVRS